MSATTQNAQILDFLKQGRSLTSLEALDRFGCFRLGARVYDLKQEGHNITSTRITTESGARVAEYRLAQ